MFGASAYQESSQFRTFSVALYTMFRTLCLDGWALLVESVEEQQPEQPVPVKMFFVCFIFVVVYVLIPVFVAAILDGYRSASYVQTQTDQKQSRRRIAVTEETDIRMSIDSVLHSLISFTTLKQLNDKLDILFDVIDTDESDSLSYEEIKSGFLKVSGGTFGELTMEEFETINKGGEYLDDAGQMDRQNFKLAMTEQLRIYVQRKLAQYMLAIGKEDPSQELIFFALKSLTTDSGSLVESRQESIATSLQVYTHTGS